ncbi:MAG: hypothetical protein WD076_07105 [Parvularculaceae bacterium]
MRPILCTTVALSCLFQTCAAADLLLVSINGDAKVSLIDLSTQRVIADFPVDVGPHEIAVSPDGRFAYVAIAGAGPGGVSGSSVNVLDLIGRKTAARFNGVCERPHDVRVSTDGQTIFVACAPAQAVLELNSATGALVKEWRFGKDGGWFIEKSADDKTLFVPLLEGEGIVVVDRVTGAKRAADGGGQHGGLALSPDGKEVSIKAGEKISIFDASNGARRAAIATPNEAGYGRMAFTTDGSRVVFAHLATKRVSLIDARSRRILETIELADLPKVVVVSSDGNRAYASNPDADRVTVLDVEPLKVTGYIEVGKTPDGLALISD